MCEQVAQVWRQLRPTDKIRGASHPSQYSLWAPQSRCEDFLWKIYMYPSKIFNFSGTYLILTSDRWASKQPLCSSDWKDSTLGTSTTTTTSWHTFNWVVEEERSEKMASVSISGLRRNIKNVAHNYTDAQVWHFEIEPLWCIFLEISLFMHTFKEAVCSPLPSG